MAKAKQNLIKIPLGVAVYPSLHKLDTEGKFPTNKYKTDILMEPAELAAFKADFKEKVKGLGLTKDDKLPFKKDKEGNELVRLKSKFMPVGFDAKNNKLPKKRTREGDPEELSMEIGGGSRIRCLANIFKYDGGVTLQILQYQVKELKTWDATSAFEPDEDGFVAEDGETSAFAEDTDTSGDGDDLDI